MREPGVVPDVRVGQEDPVERPPLGRAPPKGGLGDEVQLPRDVGRGVHQVEALRGRLHQRQRRHVASPAGVQQRPARVAAGGVTADLREAGVLHRSEHQCVHVRRPAAARERGAERRRKRGGGGEGGEELAAAHPGNLTRQRPAARGCGCRRGHRIFA